MQSIDDNLDAFDNVNFSNEPSSEMPIYMYKSSKSVLRTCLYGYFSPFDTAIFLACITAGIAY